MLVVSDATPLNVLIRIKSVDVVHTIFDRVVIPPAVERELLHSQTPSEVREWVKSPPGWFSVVQPQGLRIEGGRDAGEREAIVLAVELGADFLLADDKSARSSARSRGLRVTGTIGVLRLAAQQHLVDLESCIASLKAIGFYLPPEILLPKRSLNDEGQEAPEHS